ncbi:MAG: PASTA domain-containing protein, partial [Desulfuromonadales bacterium]|nr:PASTA domain-containing protein [Desulfuromonadales bacterium]
KLIIVPELTGKTVAQARRKLTSIGLEALLSGGDPAPAKALAYSVASQDPEAGKALLVGKPVKIVIYGSYLGINVPNLKGLSAKKAQQKIKDAGLTPALAGGDSAPNKDSEYTVQSQQPLADEKVPAATEITIKIYGAVQYRTVPSIIGMTTSQAKSTLTASGLKPSLYGGDAAPKKSLSYKVADQSPEAGAQVTLASLVSAHVYGAFNKQAALSTKNCDNLLGATLVWDDAKDSAWCICPSGTVGNKAGTRCITDPRIAERKRNQRNFWNAVVTTAIPIIANEIATGGNSSTSGGSGSKNNHSRYDNYGDNTGTSNSNNNSANNSGPKPSGDVKGCELKHCPSCSEPGLDFLGHAVNEQCRECRIKNKTLIDKCRKGGNTGQGTKRVPKNYKVICALESDGRTCKNGYGSYEMIKVSTSTPRGCKVVLARDSWTNCYDFVGEKNSAVRLREGW